MDRSDVGLRIARAAVAVGLVVLNAAGEGGPVVQAASAAVVRTIQVGGRQRTYLLHAPAAVPGGRPAALVIALHGGGGNGRSMERLTGFNAAADREGFVVVYPDAVDRNWNDGREAAAIPAQVQNVDDVNFITALITALTREFGVDPRRVYATGISNGAFMSQRLAVEIGDRIAAIAPVVGGMAPLVRDRFAPRAPVSVLVINGTADPLVPYQGGPVARDRGQTISTAEIVRLWSRHNRCADVPETALLPDRDPADGSRVRAQTYRGCAAGTAVVLYTVEGGGHTWPGGPQYLPAVIVGPTNRDIDGTRVIWEFFEAHPRR